MSSAPNLKPGRFRAAHASFRLRMLQEQHAPIAEPSLIPKSVVEIGFGPITIWESAPRHIDHRSCRILALGMKDKDKKLRKFQFHHAPKSDPTSPAAGTSKEPPPALDLSKVLSTSSKKKKGTPPHTPTKLGFDSDSIFKPRVNRTASTGSYKQKKYSTPLMEDTNLHSPVNAGAGTPVAPCASPTSGTPAGPLTPKASRGSLREAGTSSSAAPFEKPKSKFKMAHESFRIRMFQEQYGFEPVI
ncbi:unnamed protein product [Bursaphelenchus okinawaensis]|uniref:Uncharacterized protein n=1 Tax=Bursaphelenchus okinawaensis TaxID=465554 RepID=A0A811LPZ4_9BILA|nr:unnamed protein product [Bursaphelenchus okinawaensis]CAG9125892.1 unnamed protein product [Bursaphelenchus okinawaensis]